MENTPNIDLIRPEPTDFYDLEVMNGNATKIDAAIKANEDAIEGKADKTETKAALLDRYTKAETNGLFSNPNLVFNYDFKINSKGQKIYSSTGETANRWIKYTRGSVEIVDNGIIINHEDLWQWATGEFAEYLLGKTITCSISVDDVVYRKTGTFPTTWQSGEWTNIIEIPLPKGVCRVNMNNLNRRMQFPWVSASADNSMTLNWAWIEFGEVATRPTRTPMETETFGVVGGDAWDYDVLYAVGVYAIYNNSLWKCLVQNISQPPTDDSTYWERCSVVSEMGVEDISGKFYAYSGSFSMIQAYRVGHLVHIMGAFVPQSNFRIRLNDERYRPLSSFAHQFSPNGFAYATGATEYHSMLSFDNTYMQWYPTMQNNSNIWHIGSTYNFFLNYVIE